MELAPGDLSESPRRAGRTEYSCAVFPLPRCTNATAAVTEVTTARRPDSSGIRNTAAPSVLDVRESIVGDVNQRLAAVAGHRSTEPARRPKRSKASHVPVGREETAGEPKRNR